MICIYLATPKKEHFNKTWSDKDLDTALDALRRKEMSANKASKQYGIPSSVSFLVRVFKTGEVHGEENGKWFSL